MTALSEKLSTVFSKELIEFKLAGEGPDPSQPIPAFTVPTLLVTHVEDWSTLTYETKVPRGCFVGIIYHFEVEFYIPGDAKPYKWKQDIGKGAPLNILGKEGEPGNEEKLYEAMSTEAFKNMTDRYLATIVPVEKSEK